jgi:hypothetical protein
MQPGIPFVRRSVSGAESSRPQREAGLSARYVGDGMRNTDPFPIPSPIPGPLRQGRCRVPLRARGPRKPRCRKVVSRAVLTLAVSRSPTADVAIAAAGRFSRWGLRHAVITRDAATGWSQIGVVRADPSPVTAGAAVRAAREPRRRGAHLCVPRGAILLPVMAGGAWRGNNAVYVGAFCGSEEEGCQAPFQGYAEAGYRAKQDVHKTALCIDRARSIHKLIPVPRPCRKFPSGISRRRARRAWRGN